MPDKSKSVKEEKKLSFLQNKKRLFLPLAAALVVAVIGAYTLRITFAYRQSPTMIECGRFTPALYEGVRNQAGCVAALQGFYNDKYGMKLVVDGIYGPQTALVTAYYQGRNVTEYGAVPITGKVVNDKYNKTWPKLTANCFLNAPAGIKECKKHHRY